MPDPTPTPAPPAAATPGPGTPDPANPPPNPGTVLTPDPAAPPNGADPPAAGKWPDDWRQQYAGADAKKLGVLTRYTSPTAALDALFAAQQRISAGDLKKALPENATPEQVAAFRTENGIPDKPEGYLEKLPQGLVIGDEDKPLFAKFAEKLHAKNLPPATAHAAVEFYNELQEEQAAQAAEAETAAKAATEDKLRAEWGADYRANLNHITSFIEKAPEGVSEALLNARTPDGKAIFNIPEVLQWFASQARELDPMGTIVPSGGGAAGATIDTEIADIEKLMRTNRPEYNRDTKKQERYIQLLGAREKLKTRSMA
jgi:hypothetical protein